MKLKSRIIIFLVAQFAFIVVAAIILPRDGNDKIVWSQWYRPIVVFAPILIAAFCDKIHFVHKKSAPPPESTNIILDTPQESPAPEKTLEERNAEYQAMRDEEVRRLNAAYDFTTVEGINSIPVPCREVNGTSPTGRVEYYLRGQCFVYNEQAGNEELAIAALKKAQALMFVSDMIWKRYDFLRLPEYLYKIGRWDEADAELEKIDTFFGKQKRECPSYIKDRFQSAKICKTDLMEAHTSAPYCSECAKYINRVYSISGRDKRFPKIPKTLTNDLTGHYLSCLSWHPYVENVHELQFDCTDIISYSNRPFKDERSKEEISRYDSWKGTVSRNMSDQESIEQGLLDRAKKYYQDNQTFLWIRENLPDICPKSLTGFRRIRTQNTKNYQKIVAEAAKLGKKI